MRESLVDGKDGDARLLFRRVASTAINEEGTAKEHSLRKMEVVVPISLYGEISGLPDSDFRGKMVKCLKYVKALGSGRNRGLGRCVLKEVAQ